MKHFKRIISLCLVLVMIALVMPIQTFSAVSFSSSVKQLVFNASYYSSKYADIAAAFGTDTTAMYNHFLSYGIKEGRQGSPIFNVDTYLNKNGDLKAAFGTNRESAIKHFADFGVKEKRVTAPTTDLGTNIDVRISLVSNGLNLGIDGTNVVLATESLDAAQIWTLERASDGSYKIIHKGTGKVLDVYGATNSSGANVHVYASNDTDAQRWFLFKNPNGSYVLRAKCGTTCVLSGTSLSNGANVQMTTYSGASTQLFKVSLLGNFESTTETIGLANLGDDFWANIRGVGSNYNLALSGDNVLIRYPNTGDNQTWRFVRYPDGSYRITNLKTGKALDVYAGSSASGSNVQTYVSNNTAAQSWNIYKVDGGYVLAPKCSTKCVLDVAGGGTASGTNVQIYTYNGSDSQKFKINKIVESDSEKNLAISEICPIPDNGAYEFMEVTNISAKAVNLKQYSIYRYAFSNGNARYESTGIQQLMGFVPASTTTGVTYLDKLNLSSYDINVNPGEVAVLWFVSYENRNLTVDDFKAYWESKGCNMSNVTVARIATYDSTGDLYAASKINSKAGNGFLPDTRVGVALSLIKNTNLSKRLENGNVLKDYAATADAPITRAQTAMLHQIADSIALYVVSTALETGASRNFYSYIDFENYDVTAVETLYKYIKSYKDTFVVTPFSAQVTGNVASDGCPSSVKAYTNKDANGNITYVCIGADIGTKKTTPTPGTLYPSQFAGIELESVKLTGTNSDVKFTASLKSNNFKTVGFVINTLHTQSGKTIASKNVTATKIDYSEATGYTYSFTVSDLPVKDGTVVLEVIPYAIATDGTRANGDRKVIRCPLIEATINGASIKGLKVTYLQSESSAPIADETGIKEAAKLLADDIEYYTGVEIEVDVFDPRANYPQILIASSGSGAGGNALVPAASSVGSGQYGVFRSNGDIYVVGGSAAAAEYASQLISKLLRNGNGKVELASVCSNAVKSFAVSSNTLPLTDGAEYRIMSFNVERYELNTNTARIDNFVQTAQYYGVDVIGFQEYCAKFTSLLTPKLQSAGYTVLGNQTSGGKQNYAPLAFKTSKFTLVASGWQVLSGTTTYPGHNVTWAVLKDKVTGEMFAVSSSHFYHKSDRTVADPIRKINADEIVALTNKIVTKYGCAVINMGDYNTYTMDPAYAAFTSSGVVSDSRYESIRGYTRDRSTHADGTSKPSAGSETIYLDLFFATSDTTILRTRNAMSKMTSVASDHFPTYVDIAV